MAKIILLHISNKRNYIFSSAYCLILLLVRTFNKTIKLLIANQIANLANKYNLLLENHF